MADNLTRAQRSRTMSRIKARGNKQTELEFARLLRASKISGWRRHADLPGRPDFSFAKHHVAVFVDGCFWHGCPRCYRRPKSHRKYWDSKIARNRARDQTVTTALRDRGWRVLHIWACRLRKQPTHSLRRVQRLLNP